MFSLKLTEGASSVARRAALDRREQRAEEHDLREDRHDRREDQVGQDQLRVAAFLRAFASTIFGSMRLAE